MHPTRRRWMKLIYQDEVDFGKHWKLVSSVSSHSTAPPLLRMPMEKGKGGGGGGGGWRISIPRPTTASSISSLTFFFGILSFGWRLPLLATFSEELARHTSSHLSSLFSLSLFTGSLESPMALSPAQSYYPSSTYFHQHCQWFFDPPPSTKVVLKISTMQEGGQ